MPPLCSVLGSNSSPPKKTDSRVINIIRPQCIQIGSGVMNVGNCEPATSDESASFMGDDDVEIDVSSSTTNSVISQT